MNQTPFTSLRIASRRHATRLGAAGQSTPMATRQTDPLIVKNRRATFDYEIDERYEAGISLVGSEVKSMRAGKVDVTDAYVAIEKGGAWLKQMYVAPFEQASVFQHET